MLAQRCWGGGILMSRSRRRTISRRKANEVAAGKERGPDWLETGLGLYNGTLLRNIIIKSANEAADAAKSDDEAELLRDWCENFRASFDFFVGDSEVASATRAAALSAILNASVLGHFYPKRRGEIILEARQAHAAKMRAAKKAKGALEREDFSRGSGGDARDNLSADPRRWVRKTHSLKGRQESGTRHFALVDS
jgi:hypothetical protein